MNKTLGTAAVWLAGTVMQARAKVAGNIGRDGRDGLFNVDIALRHVRGCKLCTGSALRLPAVGPEGPCQAMRPSMSAAGA